MHTVAVERQHALVPQFLDFFGQPEAERLSGEMQLFVTRLLNVHRKTDRRILPHGDARQFGSVGQRHVQQHQRRVQTVQGETRFLVRRQTAGDFFGRNGVDEVVDRGVVGLGLDRRGEVPLACLGLLQADFPVGIRQCEGIDLVGFESEQRLRLGVFARLG